MTGHYWFRQHSVPFIASVPRTRPPLASTSWSWSTWKGDTREWQFPGPASSSSITRFTGCRFGSANRDEMLKVGFQLADPRLELAHTVVNVHRCRYYVLCVSNCQFIC